MIGFHLHPCLSERSQHESDVASDWSTPMRETESLYLWPRHGWSRHRCRQCHSSSRSCSRPAPTLRFSVELHQTIVGCCNVRNQRFHCFSLMSLSRTGCLRNQFSCLQDRSPVVFHIRWPCWWRLPSARWSVFQPCWLKKILKNISGTPGDEILEKLCI